MQTRKCQFVIYVPDLLIYEFNLSYAFMLLNSQLVLANLVLWEISQRFCGFNVWISIKKIAQVSVEKELKFLKIYSFFSVIDKNYIFLYTLDVLNLLMWGNNMMEQDKQIFLKYWLTRRGMILK